jgi:hypothetical protein
LILVVIFCGFQSAVVIIAEMYYLIHQNPVHIKILECKIPYNMQMVQEYLEIKVSI